MIDHSLLMIIAQLHYSRYYSYLLLITDYKSQVFKSVHYFHNLLIIDSLYPLLSLDYKPGVCSQLLILLIIHHWFWIAAYYLQLFIQLLLVLDYKSQLFKSLHDYPIALHYTIIVFILRHY
jgi:hypothetical protein